jgi:hypothetical protein
MILKHPPVLDSTGNLSQNPFVDFDPKNLNHYPKGAGVYIYGIRVVIEGEMKFVPICVGETINLRNRLFKDHFVRKYLKNLENLTALKPTSIKENKELWDFSKKSMSILEITKLYCDLRMYTVVNAGSKRTTREHMLKLNQLKALIYFQNENFFHAKYGNSHQVPHKNISASEACNLFPKSNHQIGDTLRNFVENFYFVYANEIDSEIANLSNLEDRLNIEVKLNQALIDKFDIYTTADKRRTGRDFPIQFDFSLISNQLVNLK